MLFVRTRASSLILKYASFEATCDLTLTIPMQNDTQQMNLSIQNVNNAIDQMKARVGEEQQKAEASTQGKRDSINQRLVKAQEDLQAAEGSLDSIRSQAAGIRAESEGFKSKGPALEKEVKALQENIRGIEHSLASCDEREKDKLAPYGRNMDKVLDAINQATWRGQKPIGPLGMYVSLKDKGKWAELLRSQLGNLMTSFAVTDARDRKALSDILKSHGK